jgi:SAM-dependent methyltransferase
MKLANTIGYAHAVTEGSPTPSATAGWQFVSGDFGSPRVVGPLSAADVETIYDELIAADFYSEQYCADWNDEPYRLMANIIRDGLQLGPNARVIDIGCGAGYLVRHLYNIGIESWGYEFSAPMAARASKNTGGRVSVITSVTDVDLSGVDLAVSMEVFEHLPLSLIEAYLGHFREHRTMLLLTIPSSGVNAFTGIANYIETDTHRLDDLARDTFFRWVTVDEDPRLGGGHIMLAGYQWWEHLFLTRGFVRSAAAETLLSQYNNIWRSYNWCPYVLLPCRPDVLYRGLGLTVEPETTFLDSTAEFQLHVSTHTTTNIALELEPPNPNFARGSHATVLLFAIIEVEEYVFEERLIATTTGNLRQGPTRLVLSVRTEPGAYKLVVHTPCHPQVPESRFRLSSVDVSSDEVAVTDA